SIGCLGGVNAFVRRSAGGSDSLSQRPTSLSSSSLVSLKRQAQCSGCLSKDNTIASLTRKESSFKPRSVIGGDIETEDEEESEDEDEGEGEEGGSSDVDELIDSTDEEEL
ncbi:hypothetical protein PFISCL1PPCAC_23257, partial [Pristionchus fissidentatus]